MSFKAVALLCLASPGFCGVCGASPRVWKPTSAPSECWFGLASSADGNKLVAVGQGGICLSTNAGATWTAANSPSNAMGWWGAASSSDGTKLAVTGGGFILAGPIYLSTNSGAAWSKAGVPDKIWTSIACSAGGNIFFATATGTNGGSIYVSRDSGITWEPSEATVTNWAALACSADGNHVVAAVGSPFGVRGPIYASDDAGHNWKLTDAPIQHWRSVACSADGTRVVAATGSDRGSVFISTDAGATWKPTSAPPGSWAMASSADGATLVGVSSDSPRVHMIPDLSPPPRALICISTNYGQAWSLTRVATTNGLMNPAAVVSSTDGAKLAFVNDGGLIYVSHAPARPAPSGEKGSAANGGSSAGTGRHQKVITGRGCTSEESNSTTQDRYELIVTWGPFLGTNEQIEVAVCPGVPFSVRSQDADGKKYEVSGLLRQKGKDDFELNRFRFEETPLGPGVFGGPLFPLSLKLGDGPIWSGVPNQEGVSWQLTKERARLRTGQKRTTNNRPSTGASTNSVGSASGAKHAPSTAAASRLLVQKGRVLYELGKLDEAKAKLRKAIELDPENQAAYDYFNLVQMREYQRAVQRLLESRVLHAKARLDEAESKPGAAVKEDLVRQKRYEEAVNRFMQSVRSGEELAMPGSRVVP